MLNHGLPTKNLVLLVPPKAWETIRETLELDARSGSFDPALRQEIKQALGAVRPVTAEISVLLDVAEELPRCAHVTTGAGKAHVVGDDRMSQLKQVLRYFRSPFKLLGGRRQYRKHLV